MTKEKQLVIELTKMFMVCGDEGTKEKIAVYVEYLRDYAIEYKHDFEDVLRAIKEAGRSTKYAPKVADIIEHLKPSQADNDAEITKTVSEAMWTIKKLLAEGRGERPRFENATLQQAYNATMQREWNDCDEFDKYFAMTLKKNLTSFKGSGAYQQSLQLQEAQEKQERLEYYKNGGGLLK